MANLRDVADAFESAVGRLLLDGRCSLPDLDVWWDAQHRAVYFVGLPAEGEVVRLDNPKEPTVDQALLCLVDAFQDAIMEEVSTVWPGCPDLRHSAPLTPIFERSSEPRWQCDYGDFSRRIGALCAE